MKENIFDLIAGEGLGVSYSSQAQVGSLLLKKPWGRAKLKSFVNVVTGNFITEDVALGRVFFDSIIDLSYVYNSQDNLWRLNVPRQWAALPNPLNTDPSATALAVEADGHAVTYTKNPAFANGGVKDYYWAPGLGDGTPFLRYDQSSQDWIWYHPGKKITEVYDAAGFLKSRTDKQGHTLTFIYVNNQLTRVQLPNGDAYCIDTDASHNVVISLNQKIVLKRHFFSAPGQLTKTVLPKDGNDTADYEIGYTYRNGVLSGIEQSDQTALYPRFTNKKLVTLGVGRVPQTPTQYPFQDIVRGSFLVSFQYSAGHTQVLIGKKIVTVGFDAQSRLISFTQALGDGAGRTDVTSYGYLPTGQLGSITHPGNHVDSYEYAFHPVESPFGLRTKHTSAAGVITEWRYPKGGQSWEQDKCYAIVKTMGDSKFITWFVYNNSWDGVNGHSFLAYTVEVGGRVTQYLPDSKGCVASKKTYFAPYLGAMVDAPLGFSTMSDWVKKQIQQQITRVDFIHEPVRGRLIEKVAYASVDAKGEGIHDDAASVTKWGRNERGQWTLKTQKQSSSVNIDDVQKFNSTFDICESRQDDLDLKLVTTLETKIDPTTQCLTATKTLPYARTLKTVSNTSGAILEANDLADNQVRKTRLITDLSGELFAVISSGLHKSYQFHDGEGQLRFEVTALGRVTEYRYDRAALINTQIAYSGCVDVTKMFVAPDSQLPNMGLLQALLPTDLSAARMTYECFDGDNRLQFAVDGDSYVVEQRHDAKNNVVAKVAYAQALALKTLWDPKDLRTALSALTPNAQTDGIQQSFYDGNNDFVGEQDGDGYVTEYKRNAAGFVTKKMAYATKTPVLITNNFKDVCPVTSIKDSNTYFFPDHRGRVAMEVDAENYLTTKNYSASGKLLEVYRFATKLPSTWQDTLKDGLPVLPQVSSEDRLLSHAYDRQDRLVQTDSLNPVSRAILSSEIFSYDLMDNQIGHVVTTPNASSAEEHRSAYKQFNNFGEVTAEATAYVAALLDAATTPEQKAVIWANQSVRSVRDDTGLLLKTINPLGATTVYYYDIERRPVLMVKPDLSVVETIYNGFGEAEITRAYVAKIDVQNLAGGFLLTAADVAAWVSAHQQDAGNIETKKLYNKRALVQVEQDGEAYQTVFSYDAFRNTCQKELGVRADVTVKSSVISKYNFRKLKTSEVVQTDGVDVFKIETAYDNQFGKPSSIQKGEEGASLLEYDGLGRLAQVTDPMGHSHELTYTAFDQVATEVDAVGEVTLHAYDQVKRSETIHYPEAGVSDVIIRNLFKEVVSQVNALGQEKTFAHDVAGKITAATTPLTSSSRVYDLCGRQEKQMKATGLEIDSVYSNVDFLESTTVDPHGLTLVTTHVPDSFGNDVLSTDAKQVKHKKSYDKRSLLTSQIDDPGALKVQTITVYNGQGFKLGVTQGDLANPNQLTQTFVPDALGHLASQTIGPAALQLTSSTIRNTAGKVIAQIDANGNKTIFFCDGAGRKQFSLDAMGGLMEWVYNPNGRVACERKYKTTFTQAATEKTPLDQMIAWAKAIALPTDSMIWNFYDGNKRLAFQVDKNKTLTQYHYNVANQKIGQVVYAMRMGNPELETTASIPDWIKVNKSNLDQHSYQVLDALGRVRFKISPLGYVVEQQFNPDNKVTQRIEYVLPVKDPAATAALPVDQVKASLIKSTDDRADYSFFDILNRPIYKVDASLCVTFLEYDKLGNLLTEVQFAKPAVLPVTLSSLQALGAGNRNNGDKVTQYLYDALSRKTSKTDPLSLLEEYHVNALGQLEKRTDAMHNDWLQSYDAAKRLVTATNPLGLVEKTSYQKASKSSFVKAFGTADAREKDFAYNACGQVSGLTQDPQGADVSVSTVYNPLHQPAVKIDGNGHASYVCYHANSKVEFEVNALGFVTAYQYDAFSRLEFKTRYNKALTLNLNDYKTTGIPNDKVLEQLALADYKNDPLNRIEQYGYDADNRLIQTIVDPAGLKIITSQRYNAAGQVIAKVDANGHTTRTLYDASGRERFVISHLGNVVEKAYDLFGKLVLNRQYATSVDPGSLTDATTLADFEVQAAKLVGSLDTYVRHLRDLDGRDAYLINQDGQVECCVYDDNGYLKKRALFADAFVGDIFKADMAALNVWVPAHQVNQDNRCSYFIRDHLGRERFVVDVENYITEQIFNDFGQVIAKIQYAIQVTNLTAILSADVDKVRSLLSLDPVNDRTTYTVFDGLGRKAFSVDAEKGITGLTYDHDSNLETKVHYAVPIPQASLKDQPTLTAYLFALKPGDADRVTTYGYDAANRKVLAKDPAGFTERFDYNGFDEEIVYHDQANADWVHEYDNAGRRCKELMPVDNYSMVEYQANASPSLPGKLVEKKLSGRVESTILYDAVGNKTGLVSGSNLDAKRAGRSLFDADNRLVGVALDNVDVDDPSLPATFGKRPVKTGTIQTTKVLDAKSNVVAEQNLNGAWRFSIFNAANRLIYSVDALGYVVQYQRNIFGDVMQEMHYANKSALDLSVYIKTGKGILQADLEKSLQPDSEHDRVKIYERNRRGQPTKVTRSEVFFYYAAETPVYGLASPTLIHQYNAFGDRIFSSEATHAIESGFSNTRIFVDRNGQKVAEVDAMGYVTRLGLNAFKEVVSKAEWEKPITIAVGLATTLAAVDAAHIASDKDRLWSCEYEKRGLILKETLHAVEVQQLVKNGDIYDLQDAPAQDHVVTHQYTARGKTACRSLSVPGGSDLSEFVYYNARDQVIAKTKVARDRVDPQGAKTTLVPLTLFGVDPFGKPVTQLKSALGTSSPQLNQLPTYMPNAADQLNIQLMDSRGLMSMQQDGLGNLSYSTFTGTKKVARQYFALTEHAPKAADIVHLDEQRFNFDAEARTIANVMLRDGELLQTTAAQYNGFGELTGEGPGDATWPLQQSWDRSGRMWRTNREDGAHTILLYDIFTGKKPKQSARWVSPSEDLSQVQYSDLKKTLESSTKETLEQTRFTRDVLGRIKTQWAPLRDEQVINLAKNMPLNVVVSNDYTELAPVTLSWANLQETSLIAELEYWPLANPDQKVSLGSPTAIKGVNRVGYDLSKIPTDLYGYQISYREAAAGPQGNVEYQSVGQFQCVTTVAGGLSLFALPGDDAFVTLYGKMTGITEVDLFSNGVLVATCPVLSHKGNPAIDLTGYPSGDQYQVVAKDSKDLSVAFPFTVYTQKPAVNPLARTIDSSAQISVLDDQAELAWTVPADCQSLPANVIITYTAQSDGKQYTETFSVNPLALDERSESSELAFKPNIKFKLTPSKLLLMDVQLVLKNSDQIPLLTKVVPVPISLRDVGADQAINFDLGVHASMVLSGVSSSKTLEYFDATMDCKAQWKSLPDFTLSTQTADTQLAGVFVPFIVADVTVLTPCLYPYQVTATDGRVQKGSFLIKTSSAAFEQSYPSGVFNPTPGVIVARTDIALDRWNNPVSRIDFEGHEEINVFNKHNKCTCRTQAAIPVTDEQGVTTFQQPVTRYGFDIQGHGLGTKKANGGTHACFTDAEGQLVMQVNASGVVSLQVWDALSRREAYTKIGRWWTIGYDQANNQIALTTPAKDTTIYGYDERARRNKTQYSTGAVFLSNCDTRGNVANSYLATGEKTDYTYDRNHGLESQTYSDKTSIEKPRDYFGKIVLIKDLSNLVITNGYDKAKRLISEVGTNRTDDTTHYDLDLMSVTKEWAYEHGVYSQNLFSNNPHSQEPVTVVVTSNRTIAAKNISRQYQPGGSLIGLTDHAIGMTTQYGLNKNGKPVLVMITDAKGVLIQSIKQTVNALGYEVQTSDAMSVFITLYDIESNRRSIQGRVSTPWGAVASAEAWSTYRLDGRVLISGGLLQGGKIIVANTQGQQITYNPDGSVSTVYFFRALSSGAIPVTQTPTFDVNGNMATLKGTDGTLSAWTVDASNRFVMATKSIGMDDHGQLGAETDSSYTYNLNGWVTGNITTESGNTQTATMSNFLPEGDPQDRDVVYGDGSVKDHYHSGYELRDQPILVSYSGSRTDQYGTSWAANSLGYDVNDNLNSEMCAYNIKVGDQEADGSLIVFQSTTMGNVLLRHRVVTQFSYSHSVFSSPKQSLDLTLEQLFYTAGDSYLGSYGLPMNGDNSSSLMLARKQRKNGFGGRGLLGSAASTSSVTIEEVTEPDYASEHGDWEVVAHPEPHHDFVMVNAQDHALESRESLAAKIEPNILSMAEAKAKLKNGARSNVAEASSSTAPKPEVKSADIFAAVQQPVLDLAGLPRFQDGLVLPSQYIVQNGDTFASIAVSVYHDSSVAPQIANANNLPVSATLPVGQPINLPESVQLKNGTTVHTNFARLMNTLIGNFESLNLVTPNPSASCLQTTLEVCLVIDAVIVGVLTAGAGAPISAGLMAAAEAFAIAAVVAAAVDLVGQELLVLTKVQQKILWTSVIETGLSAGFGSGMGALIAKGIVTAGDLAESIVESGVTDLAEQLSEIAVGLKRRLDTTELVTASASAGVGHEVGAAMAGANNIEVGVAQSIAGDLTSSLIRGRADPEMILGGALGTMGGLYLGNKIQQRPFFAEGAANNRARAQANEYSAVKQIVAVTAGSSRMIGLNSEDVNQDGNVSSDNQSQSSGAKAGNNYGLSFDFGVGADGKVNAQERVLNYATGSTTEVAVGGGSGGVLVSGSKSGFFSSAKSVASRVVGDIQKLAGSPEELFDLAGTPSYLLAPKLAVGFFAGPAAKAMEGYVAEHGSVGVELVAGGGLALDVYLGFSKQGVTMFGGFGVGFGFGASLQNNYDFPGVSGITSRTSISASLGGVPVQAGGSVMVSKQGPALSAGIQSGEGFEIDTVVGVTKTFGWDSFSKNRI